MTSQDEKIAASDDDDAETVATSRDEARRLITKADRVMVWAFLTDECESSGLIHISKKSVLDLLEYRPNVLPRVAAQERHGELLVYVGSFGSRWKRD